MAEGHERGECGCLDKKAGRPGTLGLPLGTTPRHSRMAATGTEDCFLLSGLEERAVLEIRRGSCWFIKAWVIFFCSEQSQSLH